MIFNVFRDISDLLLNLFEILLFVIMNVKKNFILFLVLVFFKVFFIKFDFLILIIFINIRNMEIWILGYSFYKIVIFCLKREYCMFLFIDRFICIDGCGYVGVRSDVSIVYCMDMVNRRMVMSYYYGFIFFYLLWCFWLLYLVFFFKGFYLYIYILIIFLIV